MREVYDNLMSFVQNGLENSNLNVKELYERFIEESSMILSKNDSIIFNVNSINGEERKYFNGLIKLYTLIIEKYGIDKSAWTDAKNIGSFYIKNLLGQIRLDTFEFHHCDNFMDNFIESIIDKVDQLFTIPEHNISLPDINHLYSMIDFRELSHKSLFGQSQNSYPSQGILSLVQNSIGIGSMQPKKCSRPAQCDKIGCGLPSPSLPHH